jgi:peptide/nickel transport system permease protein
MTADTLDTSSADAGEPPWRLALHRLMRRRAALTGLAVVVFFIALALAAPLVAPYDPLATDWRGVRKPPSLQHLFGTDELGRDILSRVAWGAHASILAGLVSVSIALAVGVPLGLLSGYFGGFADGVLMRMIDAMLAIPFLILAIALAAFLGPNLTNAMIAIGVSQTPVFTRLTRGQVLAVKHEDFVDVQSATRIAASCCAMSCPMFWRRSWSRRPSQSRRRSSPRRASPFWGSGSSPRRRAGAACSIRRHAFSRRRRGWRCGRAWRSSA